MAEPTSSSDRGSPSSDNGSPSPRQRDADPDEARRRRAPADQAKWPHPPEQGRSGPSDSGLASEEKYRTLFHAIDQGFCIVEMLFDDQERPVDYRFLEVNAAFEDQTGLEDAVGRTMRSLRPDHEEHWFRIYGEIAKSGEPRRFENQALALGRWYDVYAFRIGRPEQHHLGVLFSDVTNQKEREAELREAKRMAERANAAKSDFMATISHELRTPLNAIIGYTELLLEGVPEHVPPKAEGQVRRIAHGARHLRELISEVLTFSRLEAGRESVEEEGFRIGDLLDEIRAVVEPLVQERDLRLIVDAEDAPEAVRTDPRKVRQILVNLLGNAVKFTKEGTIALRIHVEENWILFRVSDTGRGIAPKDLDRLFEPFWQGGGPESGTAGGTGLGLTISRRYASILGGDISAESTPGEGSVFTLRLPLPEGGE